MRKFLPFLFVALLELTGSRGEGIYLVVASVVDVTPVHNGSYAPPDTRAQIRTSNGLLFVRETPAEVARQLRNAD